MAAAGIICEYNPFHRGHLWQIAEIRRRLGEDTAIVCAMSGNFVQRGDFAIARKHTRAAAAIAGGADLVLENPLPWAISSAEGFGRGGVSVLAAAGVVDTLCFGSECADAEKLLRVAKTLESEAFSAEVRAHLSSAASFASVRQEAAETLLGEDAGVMSDPNDILGIAYAQAVLKKKSAMTLMALPRQGAAHDGGICGGYASASFLRERMQANESVDDHLSPGMARLYAEEAAAGRAPVTLRGAERTVLARLRFMSEEEMSCYDEGGEGLYHRIFEASRTASAIDDLLGAAKTKRYAYAALRRMVLRMYLGVTAEESKKELPYLRVLACSARGREVLKEMKKAASLPILTKPAGVRKLGAEAQHLFSLEARATDLYTLAYPMLSQSVGGSEWTGNPVIVE